MPEYEDLTAIAVNKNNTAGLALVSSLTADGRHFLAPKTAGDYRRGETQFKINGLAYTSGVKTKVWRSAMSLGQYTFIRDAYTGFVTAQSWLENTTLETFNAALSFKEIADYEVVNVLTPDIGWAVIAVEWLFLDVVVIPEEDE